MRLSSLCLLLAFAVLGCKGTTGPKDGEEIPPYPWATQAWRASMRASLHETRITQNYDGVPLKNILQDIARRARVNLWTDTALFDEPKDDLQVVRARLSDCPADDALDAVLRPLDLAWGLRNEFVCVAMAKDLPPQQENDQVAERILRARDECAAWGRRKAAKAHLENFTLIADYENRPLESVLDDLSDRTKVAIRFDAPGLAPPKGAQGVSMKGVAEVRAVNLLSHVLDMHGLGFTWRCDEVRVVPREEAEAASKRDKLDEQSLAKPVTFAVERVPLRELAKAFTQASATPVLLDEATWNRVDLVTLKVTEVELREVLVRIKDDAKCATVLMDGVIFFLAPSE